MGKKSSDIKKRKREAQNKSNSRISTRKITEEEEKISKKYMKDQGKYLENLMKKNKGKNKLLSGGTTGVTKKNVKEYGKFLNNLNKKIESNLEKGKSAREVMEMEERAKEEWWEKHQQKRAENMNKKIARRIEKREEKEKKGLFGRLFG